MKQETLSKINLIIKTKLHATLKVRVNILWEGRRAGVMSKGTPLISTPPLSCSSRIAMTFTCCTELTNLK